MMKVDHIKSNRKIICIKSFVGANMNTYIYKGEIYYIKDFSKKFGRILLRKIDTHNNFILYFDELRLHFETDMDRVRRISKLFLYEEK